MLVCVFTSTIHRTSLTQTEDPGHVQRHTCCSSAGEPSSKISSCVVYCGFWGCRGYTVEPSNSECSVTFTMKTAEVANGSLLVHVGLRSEVSLSSFKDTQTVCVIVYSCSNFTPRNEAMNRLKWILPVFDSVTSANHNERCRSVTCCVWTDLN